MNILMFTTLLILLYPPLKGFSHRSDSRIHVYQALLLRLSRASQAIGFRYRGISGFAYQTYKNRCKMMLDMK